MKKPEVTIILTNYNYENYVRSAINSIIEQDYKGQLNLVIVDDGSTDRSQELIDYEFFADEDSYETKETNQSFYSGKISMEETVIDSVNLLFIMTENRGASVARNVGINYGLRNFPKTKIIGIIDADDEYYANKVSRLVEKLMEHKEIGVAYSDYDILKTYNDKFYTKREHKEPYSALGLRNKCIVSSGSLVKVEFLKKVAKEKEYYNPKLHGPKSEGFIGCTEDYDLWLRLSNHCIMIHVPETLSLAKEHGDNQSLQMTPEIFQQNAQIIMGG
jgi:glycosyltransferase involved in cell wall biosynthesis